MIIRLVGSVGEGVIEQAADGGKGQILIGEINVTVAALEADFLLDAD